MDTLTVDPTTPIEEHVGHTNGRSAHGTVDSANAHGKNTTVQKQHSVTWADVVKGVARKRDTELKKNRIKSNLIREVILSKQSRK